MSGEPMFDCALQARPFGYQYEGCSVCSISVTAYGTQFLSLSTQSLDIHVPLQLFLQARVGGSCARQELELRLSRKLLHR